MISPVGLTADENWSALTAGQSGIGPITSFDTESFAVKIAGEVKGFDPESVVDKKSLRKMDRFVLFGLSAADMAIKEAGLDFSENELLRSRTGTIVGVGIGGLQTIEKQTEIFLKRGPSRITPFFIPMVITNMAAGQLSIRHGLRGPNFSVTSACASGVHAIGEAAKYIQDGTCDVMLAGGVESAVSQLAIAGFSSMKALSTRNDQATQASRPFDENRDGFVLSEGGAIFVLEDYEHASRRGATIYAEVSGYGVSSDAHHMTNPSPQGEGASLAMKLALKDSALNPEDISYINAHGTSTPAGDGIETAAIKNVFQDHAKKLWVSSTKSMTGHALGGAGALESAYSLLTLKHQVAPPTINLENPSDGCDLDYVPHHAREGSFKHVLNNSFGFGGTNGCLIFSKL